MGSFTVALKGMASRPRKLCIDFVNRIRRKWCVEFLIYVCMLGKYTLYLEATLLVKNITVNLLKKCREARNCRPKNAERFPTHYVMFIFRLDHIILFRSHRNTLVLSSFFGRLLSHAAGSFSHPFQ